MSAPESQSNKSEQTGCSSNSGCTVDVELANKIDINSPEFGAAMRQMYGQPGAINWFEIPATNLKRARDFYTKIFDWEFSELPESWDKEGGKTNPEYLTFSKKGTMVMGGMPLVSEESMLNVDREGIVSVRLSMVVVDMEDALKRIVEAGGRVIKQKAAIGGEMGFAAVYKDTEGNANNLWCQK